MSGVKWTPGPWSAFDNGLYFEINVGIEEGQESQESFDPSICHVSDNPHYNHTRNRAKENADLIAAAPDMARALQDFLDFAQQDVREMSDEVWHLMSAEIKQAERALAKARGELEKEAE